jgi:hypothetical protein
VRGILGKSEFADKAPHPNPLPVKNGERERAHASSESSPLGRSNSKVFSVIDTMV